MAKQDFVCCFILQGTLIISAFVQGNQIIQAKKDSKKSIKVKVFATLTKQISFSITKTQILQNKKYKFHIQLKLKNKENLTLIIDGKDDLEYYIKRLSQFGMASGLQQMIVSCEKVGQGSFAQVYKVITNYDTIMALKAFDRKNLKIHKNKLAFQNQIDIMRSLHNRYIVSVDGIFETEKNIYIKMQYFSFSLKSFLRKNISIKMQKKIMKQLLQALLQMKQKKIIHRDLKPQNIMIRGKNQKYLQCVIIDFGLATQVDVEKYIFTRCGTPGFLAPQIAKMSTKNEKLTPACDIFSLGCIFYRMLTKKYIFSAENYNKVIEKNKAVDIPWSTFALFSQNQKNLIAKMLQKNPFQRITPQQALKHPYFIQQIDDQDEIPSQACDLQKKMSNFSSVLNILNRKQSIQSLMSSFHINSNGQLSQKGTYKESSVSSMVQRGKYLYKDSCLSFEGPIRQYSQGSKDIDFLQPNHHTTRHKKRISRFSQINQTPVL